MSYGMLATLFHVVTLNVWGLPNLIVKELAPHLDERIDGICQILKTRSAQADGWDVVFIQEAWTTASREPLKNCGYPFVVDLDSPLKLLDSGLMILSRHPIDHSSVDRLTYDENGDPDSAFQDGEYFASKSVIGAKILHPQAGSIWVATTHMVSRYSMDDKYEDQRRFQAMEMLNWVEDHAAGLPIVMGGDFNFGPGSVLWGEFKAMAFNFRYFNPAGPGGKFCTHENDDGSGISCWIDHLFGSRAKPVAGRRAFEDLIAVDGKSIHLSDHFGFETAFEIKI